MAGVSGTRPDKIRNCRFPDSSIWWGVGGRLNRKNLKKGGIFNLRMGNRILMNFDLWKDIVFQSSYFKSRPDQVILGGGLEGET